MNKAENRMYQHDMQITVKLGFAGRPDSLQNCRLTDVYRLQMCEFA